MPLFDFFRINLPYGLQKNSVDEWFAFNREYVLLGWNRTHGDKSVFGDRTFAEYPIHTKYKRLTETAILKIIKEDHAIQRGEDGKIMRIFFYNDGTNPRSNLKYWNRYFDILKAFSQFDIPYENRKTL